MRRAGAAGCTQLQGLLGFNIQTGNDRIVVRGIDVAVAVQQEVPGCGGGGWQDPAAATGLSGQQPDQDPDVGLDPARR
jgi:hypothetical protein